jgi:hypothetical protein
MTRWHNLSIEQAFTQLDSRPERLADFESVTRYLISCGIHVEDRE